MHNLDEPGSGRSFVDSKSVRSEHGCQTCIRVCKIRFLNNQHFARDNVAAVDDSLTLVDQAIEQLSDRAALPFLRRQDDARQAQNREQATQPDLTFS